MTLRDPLGVISRLRGRRLAGIVIVDRISRYTHNCMSLETAISILEEFDLTIVNCEMRMERRIIPPEPSAYQASTLSEDSIIEHVDIEEVPICTIYTEPPAEYNRGYMGGSRGGAVMAYTHAVFPMPPPEYMWQARWRTEYEMPISTAEKPDPEIYQKSEELLKSILTETELEEYQCFNTITINTEIGLFRIRARRDLHNTIPPTSNVNWKNKVLCLVIGRNNIPYLDHIVMQTLIIKTQPQRFVDTARVLADS